MIDREPPEFRNRRLQMLVRYREAMLAIVVDGNARRLPCCGACPTMTISVVIMRNPLEPRLPPHQTIFRPNCSGVHCIKTAIRIVDRSAAEDRQIGFSSKSRLTMAESRYARTTSIVLPLK